MLKSASILLIIIKNNLFYNENRHSTQENFNVNFNYRRTDINVLKDHFTTNYNCQVFVGFSNNQFFTKLCDKFIDIANSYIADKV